MTGTGDVGNSRALAQKGACFPPLGQSQTGPRLMRRDALVLLILFYTPIHSQLDSLPDRQYPSP
eukprot:150386-Pyramimonas_sp.AAC.1